MPKHVDSAQASFAGKLTHGRAVIVPLTSSLTLPASSSRTTPKSSSPKTTPESSAASSSLTAPLPDFVLPSEVEKESEFLHKASPIAYSNVSPESDPDAQADLVDNNGRRFVWVRKSPPFDPLAKTPHERGELESTDMKEEKKNIKLIADMTLEELAAKLRPRLFTGGHEYLLDHNPIEMARFVRENENTEITTPGMRPDGIPLSSETIGSETSAKTAPEFIIGSDDRVSYDHWGISWPAMTAVHFPDLICTGTIIGLNTVATAGHCVLPSPTGRFFFSAYSSDTSYPTAVPDLQTVDDFEQVVRCAGGSPSTARLSVDITHSCLHDVEIQLISTSGHGWILTNQPPFCTVGTQTAYNVSANINLSGEAMNQRWTLRVIDKVAGDAGTLTS